MPASFVHADAQTHAFVPASFDTIISRFGVMFFENAVDAFANLLRAATSDASLAFVAWRTAAENPFMTTAERAAAPLVPNLPARQPDAPGQFSSATRGGSRPFSRKAAGAVSTCGRSTSNARCPSAS